MPATESTWRNTKTLHVIFGLSSIAMLLATIWMFAQDHDREWRRYQQVYYTKLEVWNNETRILAELARNYEQRRGELEQIVSRERLAAPRASLVDAFAAELADRKASTAAGARTALASLDAQVYDMLTASNRWTDARVQKAAGDAAVTEQQVQELQKAFESAETGVAAQLKQLAAGSSDVQVKELLAAFDRVSKAGGDDARKEAVEDFRARLDAVLDHARFEEENLLRNLKFARADLDVAKSELDLRISDADIPRLQAAIDAVQARVNELQLQYEAASAHRKRLDGALTAIRRGEAAAKRALDQHTIDLKRLQDQRDKNQANILKSLVQMPILDAFAKSGDIKLDQIWLPELKIDYRHARVARFDRCINCHLGIDKGAPGAATEPAYAARHVLPEPLLLATPKQPPEHKKQVQRDGQTVAENKTDDELLAEVYGLRLSEEGLFAANDVTVDFVLPRTPAADARLKKGDVIQFINDTKLINRATAVEYLLRRVAWGKPLRLTVQRGFPQPYSGHPRLDLFVSDVSPHSSKKFGCTICHDGQGTATAFKWVQHTPNSVAQLDDWTMRYGWFNNHHWEYPMRPSRFVESNCLKCHFDLTDLEPSERFPKPPAPKLMQGYDLVRTYGCFGCHEIRGWEGTARRIGPDLRLEPNYFAAALALYVDPRLPANDRRKRFQAIFGKDVEVKDGTLADEELAALHGTIQQFASQLVADPTLVGPRHRLIELLDADAKGAKQLHPDMHKLSAVLADVDVPGEMRRVGPSLRYVMSKVDRDFLYDWLHNPQNFRPSTKMPRFFGLVSHLEGQSGHGNVEPGKPEAPAEPAHTLRLETAEILGIVEYLAEVSQPTAYFRIPEQVTLEPSAERGKYLFETRGCLACHQHKDFPEAKETQAPDLSNIGDKLTSRDGTDDVGRRWLYTWLRNPTHYHNRTKMPDLFLLPIQEKRRVTRRNAQGQEETVFENAGVSDPAADITAYLMQSKSAEGAYKPVARPDLSADAALSKSLYDLALEHLRGTFTLNQAQSYLTTGIPESLRGELKGDEVELLGTVNPQLNEQERAAAMLPKVLRYVGRRSLNKYGCFGCHDIPGFEDAKPIGTGLADWGKKDPARIAFEQIHRYIEKKEAHRGDPAAAPASGASHGAAHGHLDVRSWPAKDQDEAYLTYLLIQHQREGFLFQKLREPRSFDYEKTGNKRYNERLRMPQFPFNSQAEVEAVMTFVLGLLADPPAEKFIYRPGPRQKAIVEGRKVLEKYHCGGCHQLQSERFEYEYLPDYAEYGQDNEFPADEFPFLKPHFTPEQLANSKHLDNRGRGHAVVYGGKVADSATGVVSEDQTDDEDRKIYYLRPARPVAINGKVFSTFPDQLTMPVQWQTGYSPPVGGFLARYLPNVLMKKQQEIDPGTPRKYDDVLGWVPPPLMGEGSKVQPAWLHGFLLEPYLIRPAIQLRMPRFNMSPREAETLVNYFAAVDNEAYPHEFDPRTTFSRFESLDERGRAALEDALLIVTNTEKCVKCHIVGDYAPPGSELAMGPNLDRVHERLRPTYLRNWIANPKRILPYTGMPVNIKVNEPIRENAFKTEKVQLGPLITEGTATEQVDALVDLLLNYDKVMKSRQSVKPLINEGPPPATPAAGNAP